MYATLFRSETAAPTRANVAALILRISLAVVFLFHGLDKIVKGNGGAAWVNHMYARMPTKVDQKPKDERTQPSEQIPTSVSFAGTQLAVAWGEFLGGLALAIGMLTRLAALGLILIQVGAVILVTLPRGFSFAAGGGYEYNFALIAMCLALLILGPGRWSLDWFLLHRRTRTASTTAAPAPLPVSGPHGMADIPAEQVAPGATR